MINYNIDFTKKEYRKENYIKNNYPDLYSFLINEQFGKTFCEKLYNYVNNINEYPTCKTCGNLLKFHSFTQGYRIYCCSKCANSNTHKKEKVINTNIIRYGVKCTLSNKDIKEKSKLTCLKKYGVEYHTQSESTKHKIKESVRKKYGVDNVFQIKEIIQKSKETCLKKYGVDSPVKNKNILQKQLDNYKKYIINKYEDIIDYNPDTREYICACPHTGCNKCNNKKYKINSNLYFCRRYNNTEKCTKLLPHKGKKYNTSLEFFIINYLNQHNIDYITKNRKMISPYEIDIYIPSKNIAIECNGIRWHSTKFKKYDYHINKYIKCRENNIKLFCFWEDQFINSPNYIYDVLNREIFGYKNPPMINDITFDNIHGIYLDKNIMRFEIDHNTRSIYIDNISQYNLYDIIRYNLVKIIKKYKYNDLNIYINNDIYFDINKILDDHYVLDYIDIVPHKFYIDHQNPQIFIRNNTEIRKKYEYTIYDCGYSLYKLKTINEA